MLARKFRLRLKNDFKKVFELGKFYPEKFLAIKILSNGSDVPRFGFIVSKKVSKKATVRNKVKRRLRESVRLKIKSGLIKDGFDAIVLTRPETAAKNFAEIDEAMNKLLKKARVLKN